MKMKWIGLVMMTVVMMTIGMTGWAQEPLAPTALQTPTQGHQMLKAKAAGGDQAQAKKDGQSFVLALTPSSTEDVVVPIAAFLLVLGLIGMKYHSKNVQTKARVEAIRIFAEKGQPVPPELLKMPTTNLRERRSPKSRSLIFIAAGIGMIAYFGFTAPAEGQWAWGLACLAFGLGNWMLSGKDGGSSSRMSNED